MRHNTGKAFPGTWLHGVMHRSMGCGGKVVGSVGSSVTFLSWGTILPGVVELDGFDGVTGSGETCIFIRKPDRNHLWPLFMLLFVCAMYTAANSRFEDPPPEGIHTCRETAFRCCRGVCSGNSRSGLVKGNDRLWTRVSSKTGKSLRMEIVWSMRRDGR